MEKEYISEKDLIDIFANNLRDIMNEVGISQKQLAYEAETTEASISRYLNKRKLPDLKILINICYILECEVSDLIPAYAMVY